MAATAGPDMMMDTSVDGFGLDTTRDFTVDHIPSQDSSLASPQMSPRSTLPPPNPPFVFPARPSSYSAPSSFSRATGRRPRSAIESKEPALVIATDGGDKKSRSPALPAFSFNPGAALPPAPVTEHAFLIPPKSPSAPDSPRSAPIRPGGHRRGGSEFVGGSIRGGDAVSVLSTSPTKSESGMASPLLQPTKPSRPRGHAHRRSAAISSHDLSSIILPSPSQNLRGSSAPASPAIINLDDKDAFPALKSESQDLSSADLPLSESMSKVAASETPVSALEVNHSSKPPARNRVGFSDTLEFIPRPLSLVSNETSSTITARPGHSVSGSISSVISITNQDREMQSPVGLSPVRNVNDTRPSTAGAILERTQSSQDAEPLPSPRRRGSIPFLGALPPTSTTVAPATPSPTKSVKKWSFFGLDPFVASSPTRSRPLSSSSSESQKESSTLKQEVTEVDHGVSLPVVEHPGGGDMKPITKKRSKKQKKVKTWAGSILSRKSKARHAKQKRKTPTPPPFPRGTHSYGADLNGPVSMSAEPESGVPELLVTDSTSDVADDSWNPASESDEETSYPMIDLDAALGPFNTPLPRNPEWEAAQRAGGLVKKQLHSAAGMSRFSGPGMHYHHRRAESAPEMAPFEAGRLGFPRFGSSSTMADVFEEDEEDEDDSATKSTGQSTPVAETPVTDKPATLESTDAVSIDQPQQPVAVEGSAVLAAPREKEEQEPDVNGGPVGTPTLFNRSATSLHDQSSMEISPAHIVIPVSRCSLDSATPSPRHIMRPKELAPVDVPPLNLPSASLAPVSPYSMTQSSAFPSPRSPMSYDAHRISTAPSSITEDNFQSLLMGEPGPEVRVSVDIPSLTSSNSTMTRESLFAQHPQARPAPISNQPRPASFTSTAFGRRRSSLASLSRLISSSHGERSKLSMEVPMDNEPEKKAKVSKAKRLSRLVQFWKTKEAESA